MGASVFSQINHLRFDSEAFGGAIDNAWNISVCIVYVSTIYDASTTRSVAPRTLGVIFVIKVYGIDQR